jgi:hypothetical protein
MFPDGRNAPQGVQRPAGFIANKILHRQTPVSERTARRQHPHLSPFVSFLCHCSNPLSLIQLNFAAGIHSA